MNNRRKLICLLLLFLCNHIGKLGLDFFKFIGLCFVFSTKLYKVETKLCLNGAFDFANFHSEYRFVKFLNHLTFSKFSKVSAVFL